MAECIAKYYFHNGNLEKRDHFRLNLVYEGESIYEVVRVQQGVPLFLEEHVRRLERTAALRRIKLPKPGKNITADVYQYAVHEGIDDGNLKVVVNVEEGKPRKHHYLIYRIEHHYPDASMYREGVHCVLHYAERFQPEAKVINPRLRNVIFRKLIETRRYEALLVDRENRITEGSRSNVFLILEGKLFTAPENRVLPGISRAHLLQLARERNIPVHFEAIPVERLRAFEALFLTGTSIRVLPVSEIGELRFNPGHPLIRDLSSDYEHWVQQYIRLHRPVSPIS